MKTFKIAAAFACLFSFALSSCKPDAGPGSSAVSSGGASSASASAGSEGAKRGPLTVGQMKLQRLFYTPAGSGTVYYVDIRRETPAMILALRCLQGLAAREDKAAIFLSEGENDQYWRMYLESEYAVNFQDKKPEELFELYRDRVAGLYLYDEARPEFLDAVLTAAACENAIPVTGSMLEWFGGLQYGAEKRVDFRGKWADAKAACESVYADYAEKCNPNYIYAGGAADFTDYAYAVRAFFLSADAAGAGLSAVFTKLLQRQEPSRVALILGGAANAEALTRAGAPYGYAFFSCAANANTTFFSSLPAASKPYSQPIAVDRKAVSGKRYVSLIFTDSMALDASHEGLRGLWEEANGSILPFAFQLSPLLAELSPAVLNWYYQNRSSHSEIVACAGGFAAFDREAFPPALLTEWFALEDFFLNRSGIRVETALKLRSAGGTAGYALAVRRPASGSGEPPLLEDAPACAVSHGPLGRDAFAAWAADLAAMEADDTAQFHAVFLDPSGFEQENVWEFILLQVKALQQEAPGKIEFVLPGDLLATARSYAAARASSGSEASSGASQ